MIFLQLSFFSVFLCKLFFSFANLPITVCKVVEALFRSEGGRQTKLQLLQGNEGNKIKFTFFHISIGIGIPCKIIFNKLAGKFLHLIYDVKNFKNMPECRKTYTK
jgi:hypothetical protein